MESSTAGADPRPSLSGGASPPPPPPPPPPRGWIAGIVSGAGRLLAAVLGPDSSVSGSTTTAASDGASPSASTSPSSSRPSRAHGVGYDGGTDHGNSPLFPPRNNQLNQSEKETVLKDYAEGSLAIISDIEPKDAIIQLLMQETYSRSECSTLIKIIQERVVNSDSGEVVAGGLALPINRKAGGRQATVGYSSFSPNISSPPSSTLPIHGHGFDNSTAAGAAPTFTPVDQGFFNNADKIQSVLKRSYSVAGYTPEDLRRVRPKINGNLLNISKFKQVDVIRNHPGEKLTGTAKNHDAFEGFSGDDKKLLSDVPLLVTNNLKYSNIISKCESAEEILGVPNKPSAVTSLPFDSSSSQAGGDHKNYDSTIFNSCSNKDLKNGFPLKVEPLNVFIPFEQKMVDLSHQKHEHAACDDSCSVSKLMFKEDIKAAPSLPMGAQLQNGSKNRIRKQRKQSNSQRTAPTTTTSPAKGAPRKNNDATVKSEIDLLEQGKLILVEQEPDLGDIPVKRPAGRPRKAR